MKNVLFINRDENVQKKVSAILGQRDDYTLFIADNVKKARKIIEEEKINFVLFDVDVAMEEGVNRMLEMKDLYPDLPIVATTPIHKGEPGDAVPPQYDKDKE